MDDLVTQLRTQKLTAGDVLSSAVDIYKDNFGAYLRIILLLLIPLSLLSIYVGESLLQFPIAFASLLPQIGIIALTHRAIYGSVPDSTEASFSSLLTLVFAAAVTTFLTGIVIGIGAIFLIIPGIIAGIRLSFVLHALVLRGQNSIDSLSYSNEVAKAHGWHIFGVLFFVGLVTGIPAWILGYLIGPYAEILTPFLTVLTGIASTILFLNLNPTPTAEESAKAEQLVGELDEDALTWEPSETQAELVEKGDDEVTALKQAERDVEPDDSA